MNLKEILEKLACKELSIEEAEKLLLLKGDLISTAIEEVDDIAKLDLYRQARTGIPEVILAEGKRPKDAALLAVKMASKSGYTLVSRVSDEVIEEIKPILPDSLEIEINEATMTANETWIWVAPEDHFSHIWGDADRLPNGNRLGVFGTYTHFANATIGARIVEVDNQGQVVWEAVGLQQKDKLAEALKKHL